MREARRVLMPAFLICLAAAAPGAAQAEAGAAQAEADVARAELRLEVTRAFWSVVTGRATVLVLEQALARAESNVGDARARLAAGVVPPNEVASAEAQTARQRMLLV